MRIVIQSKRSSFVIISPKASVEVLTMQSTNTVTKPQLFLPYYHVRTQSWTPFFPQYHTMFTKPYLSPSSHLLVTIRLPLKHTFFPSLPH